LDDTSDGQSSPEFFGEGVALFETASCSYWKRGQRAKAGTQSAACATAGASQDAVDPGRLGTTGTASKIPPGSAVMGFGPEIIGAWLPAAAVYIPCAGFTVIREISSDLPENRPFLQALSC
jgi:hypothetical protein